jgi:hypothetical protein
MSLKAERGEKKGRDEKTHLSHDSSLKWNLFAVLSSQACGKFL